MKTIQLNQTSQKFDAGASESQILFRTIKTTSQSEILILLNALTDWGRVTYIWVSKLTIIASDNGLLPGRRQAIMWNKDGILLIWPLRTYFNEILIVIHSFLFKKMHLKMSSGKWRPFCFGLNVLNWVENWKAHPHKGGYLTCYIQLHNARITTE